MLSGSTFDYRREAGITWENSICLCGIRWVMRNFGRARMGVERPTGKMLENGEEEYLPAQNHPFSALWNRPNPYYSRNTLLKGAILSYMADGNGHIFINRSRAKRAVELYYVPHFMLSPRWLPAGDEEHPTFPGESTNYIDHWEHRVDGKIDKWRPNDVFHWRDGIDPQNARRGLSGLGAVLREIAGDNSASVMSASLLRNSNVPGLMISAKQGKDGQSSFRGLSPDEESKLKALAKEKWSGDRVGELMIVPAAVDVSKLGFTPKEMDLAPNRRINEERIMAQWGIPLAVAGLGAGLEQTKVGATMKAMVALAWDQCLIPMQDELAEELTFWGQREFSDDFQDGERVFFDRSKIPALQEDVSELHLRVQGDFKTGLIKRSAGLKIYGMAYGPEDDVYATGVAVTRGDPKTGDESEDDPDDTKATDDKDEQ